LLSSHDDIAISIRVNPLFRFQRRISRNGLFDLITDNCNYGEKKIGGYTYKIKNKKKNIEKIQVIGDSISTHKNLRSLSNEKWFDGFCKLLEVPVYWIWVIRNPFETIHSSFKINAKSLDKNIELYGETYSLSHKFYEKNKDKAIIIYLEDFIKNPQKNLSKTLDLLEVSYDKKYLNGCAKLVFSKPHKVYDYKLWNESQINEVKNIIQTTPELKRYDNEI